MFADVRSHYGCTCRFTVGARAGEKRERKKVEKRIGILLKSKQMSHSEIGHIKCYG